MLQQTTEGSQIHFTEGLVFAPITELRLQIPGTLPCPSARHMAAHMLSLHLSVSTTRIAQVSQEKKKKTPYDWQNHPHAHIEIQ